MDSVAHWLLRVLCHFSKYIQGFGITVSIGHYISAGFIKNIKICSDSCSNGIDHSLKQPILKICELFRLKAFRIHMAIGQRPFSRIIILVIVLGFIKCISRFQLGRHIVTLVFQNAD